MVTSDRHFRRVSHELPGEVQIWLVDLDAYSAGVALEGLAEPEYARAARMAFARDGERFLASRHALRKLLAAARRRAPTDLVIEADEFGKLVLAEPNPLQFSLSRTANVALIGISRDRAIGVDIERVRTVPEVEELVRDHFTVDERAEWSRATAAVRDRVFLTCWTRKEACVKALGVGLAVPPLSVNAGVGQGPYLREATIALADHRCEVTVQSLDQLSQTVAAVALAAPEAIEVARRFCRTNLGSL
jgi:4'-phosphopantetheinyl transferase